MAIWEGVGFLLMLSADYSYPYAVKIILFWLMFIALGFTPFAPFCMHMYAQPSEHALMASPFQKNNIF